MFRNAVVNSGKRGKSVKKITFSYMGVKCATGLTFHIGRLIMLSIKSLQMILFLNCNLT
jgi:hypothetical protein